MQPDVGCRYTQCVVESDSTRVSSDVSRLTHHLLVEIKQGNTWAHADLQCLQEDWLLSKSKNILKIQDYSVNHIPSRKGSI